jgi:hypothetical protein
MSLDIENINNYEYDYFKSFDNNICLNPEINRRIKYILKSYKCFSNNKHYKNYLIRKTKFKNESVNKPLNSILNKITNNNYNKLKDEILELVDFIDIEYIIECIFNYSSFQIEYSDIYVNLLVYINYKYNLIKYLNNEISNFMNSKWYYLKADFEIDDDMSDDEVYDNYCKTVADKKAIIHRFTTYISLIKKLDLDVNINNISNYGFKLFKIIVKKDLEFIETSNNERNKELFDKRNFKYDIYFEFIKTLIISNKKYFRKYKKEFIENYNKIINLYESKLISAKIKFKVLDILEKDLH